MNIPDDFPRAPSLASLPGAQPKVSVRLDATSGKYVGSSNADATGERYAVCIDLVEQLVAKCRRNRSTKYAELSEVQILERLLAQLLGTDWGSPSEMAWVIRKTAVDLGWEIPDSAVVLNTLLGNSK
ncbi:hypothetical protein GTP56_05425 [Duganella sp. FT134W]|uniref:Uncharacterized protein n=1 Tax=Duganella margarita TaxID=2692170 RepID=A0A7X4GXU4_9BURK|nr:hypothetical protein [Duganella margarita]MYM71636.1 hypothetical protein [Duganella margarita]